MSSDDYLGIVREGEQFAVVHGFASDDTWPDPKPDAPRFATVEEAVAEASRIEASWSLPPEYGIMVHPCIEDPTYKSFAAFEYGLTECETCGISYDEFTLEREEGRYVWVDRRGCYGGERFETADLDEMIAYAQERHDRFPDNRGPAVLQALLDERASDKHAEVVGENDD